MERPSCYTFSVHLGEDKSDDLIANGVINASWHLPEQMRRSMTRVGGTEMVEHELQCPSLQMPVFFCDPASPWQSGTDESTNGLLRQYLSRGANLSPHNPANLRKIQKALNSRPRKPSSAAPQRQCSTTSPPSSTHYVAITARHRVPQLAHFSMIIDRHKTP